MMYGDWTVLKETRVVKQKLELLCRCKCGYKKFVRHGNLKNGRSTCCRRCANKKHGMHDTREYQAYHDAKQRCTNPTHPWYPDYGGRRIEFRFTSFEEFIGHVGRKSAGMSLDRIDNDGHYEIGNVRWATAKTQSNNQRRFYR